MKEATFRIKINKLLEAADWRFFVEGKLPANIQLEPKVTIKIAAGDVVDSEKINPCNASPACHFAN
jgi:type I restriction enzyme R subunit